MGIVNHGTKRRRLEICLRNLQKPDGFCPGSGWTEGAPGAQKASGPMPFLLRILAVLVLTLHVRSQIAGRSGNDDLVVARADGEAAFIVVADGAGRWEKQAATDLAKYIDMMTGAKPRLVGSSAELPANAPALLVGG